MKPVLVLVLVLEPAGLHLVSAPRLHKATVTGRSRRCSTCGLSLAILYLRSHPASSPLSGCTRTCVFRVRWASKLQKKKKKEKKRGENQPGHLRYLILPFKSAFKLLVIMKQLKTSSFLRLLQGEKKLRRSFFSFFSFFFFPSFHQDGENESHGQFPFVDADARTKAARAAQQPSERDLRAGTSKR